MSKDPKPLAKPYLAGEMPYLMQYRVQTWEDGEPSGKDETAYSELQKPYAYDEDEPEDYAWWEWTWPNPEWPDIPPVTYPDPVDSPCAIDDSCTFIKISGPAEMECGDCTSYTAIWVTLGCSMPPWWAVLSKWTLSGGDGECKLREGMVIHTVCCSDQATSQTLTLTVEGPYGCTDIMSIVVTCDVCCLDFTLSGNSTVNPGSTWTGTIDPPCPGAYCEVSSNSGACTSELGCGINEGGSQVTVQTDGGDCGSFTVTVTDSRGGDCSATDSVAVRINNIGQGGVWTPVDSFQGGCATGCLNYCTSFQDPCPGTPAIAGKFKYGSNTDCSDPSGFAYRGCMRKDSGSCGPSSSGTPDPGGFCPTGVYPHSVCVERDWQFADCHCAKYFWTVCEWKCTC